MKRTAKVAIRNNTTEPIAAVGVVHKYSDDYKHEGTWDVIDPGETTGSTMQVEYNTGFLTTGRDWWFVTWFNLDITKRFYSDPANVRGMIDAVEGASPDLAAKAAKTRAAAVAADLAPGAVLAAKTVAKELSKCNIGPVMNSEGTDGFKQHILREEDAGAVTEIVINGDGTIVFKSNSGESETIYKSKDVVI